MDLRPEQREVLDEPPPVLSHWGKVYAVVLVYLGLLILLMWLFTKHFKPTA